LVDYFETTSLNPDGNSEYRSDQLRILYLTHRNGISLDTVPELNN